MVKVKEDLTGWIMKEHGVLDSKLTVVRQAQDYVKPDGRRESRWLCICDCGSGKEVISSASNLKNGRTKSCGCLQKEAAHNHCKTFHKTNPVDLSGEYGIGWTLNTNNEFYFDLEDYEKIKDYCWCENYDKKRDYRWLSAWDSNLGKLVNIHQVILGKNCDHISRNTLDNRKENLRSSTFSENMQNRSKFKNNTSGVIGVSWSEQQQKWVSYINNSNHQRLWLGFYENKDDAIRVRLKAEREYYGEFAPQQHLFTQYEIESITEQNDLNLEEAMQYEA